MKFTLDELKSRRSVRSFDTSPLSEADVKELRSIVTMINTHAAGLEFQLVFNDGAPFKGFLRSYGLFSGVRNYLACVVDTSFPDMVEKAGYYAMQFVMEAQKIGISSCFVSGTYDKNGVDARIRAGRKLLMLVPFGKAELEKERIFARLSTKMMHRADIEIRKSFEGSDSIFEKKCKKYSWFNDAITAVAISPSALNKHPVMIYYDVMDARFHAKIKEENENNLIGLGIAKFSFEQVVPDGEWEFGNGGGFTFFPQS